MRFLEISLDFGILGFSKILGFFQRFFGIFDGSVRRFSEQLFRGIMSSVVIIFLVLI